MHKWLAWTEKARQDAFFAATQTNSLDNFTSLFTDFGAFLVRPLQVDWIDLRKAIIPTMPALTEIVVFQLSSSLDVESKKAFSGAVQGFLAWVTASSIYGFLSMGPSSVVVQHSYIPKSSY